MTDRDARTNTIVTSDLDPDRLLALTGWHLEDRGACRDDVCVPVPVDARTHVTALGAALQVAVVRDDRHDVWAVGPEARPHTIADARLPDVPLATRDGDVVGLRSLVGRRGVLLAWASW
jgi:hypothetical protein